MWVLAFSHLWTVSKAQSLCFCHLPIISKTPHYCFHIERRKTSCTPSISTRLSVASQREMRFQFAFITITVYHQRDRAFGRRKNNRFLSVSLDTLTHFVFSTRISYELIDQLGIVVSIFQNLFVVVCVTSHI